MESEDADPAALFQFSREPLDGFGQLVQLAVDFDADRLKSFSRARAVLLEFCGNALFDDLYEPPRRFHGRPLPFLYEIESDLFRKFFFAVIAQNFIQRLFGISVYDLSCRERRFGIHAHIERRVFLHVGKAARFFVQLKTGNAEIQKDSVEFGNVCLFQYSFVIFVVALENAETIAEFFEFLPRRRDRKVVQIGSDQTSVGRAASENFIGMPTAAERAVEINAAALYIQPRHAFFEHNGLMRKFQHISCPSSRL